MNGINFSREEIMNDPDAALTFLGFIEKNSFGYIPNDWPSHTTPEIMEMAIEFYEKIENEINVLEYFRQSNYLLN